MNKILCFSLLIITIVVSVVNGQNWVQMGAVSGGAVTSAATTPQADVYLTLPFVLLHSSNNGSTWTTLFDKDSSDKEFHIVKTTPTGSVLVVFSQNSNQIKQHIIRSTDKGVSWNSVLTNKRIIYFAYLTGNTTVVIDADNIIYRSVDDGKTFSVWDIGIPIATARIFADKKGILYASGDNASNNTYEIYRSTDSGLSWGKIINPPFNPYRLQNILPLSDTAVVAILRSGKPYVSKNDGKTWKQIEIQEPQHYYEILSSTLDSSGQITTPVFGIAKNGDSLFTVSPSNFYMNVGDASAVTSDGISIFPASFGAYTVDKNQTQQALPSTLSFDAGKIVSLGFGKGSLMAFSDNSYENGSTDINVKYSNDRGVSWKSSIMNSSLGDTFPFITTDSNQIKWTLINHSLYKHSGTTYYMGSTFDFGTTTFTSMTVGANNAFFLTSNNEGFYRSTDNGKSWDQLTYGLTTDKLYSSSWYNGHLFAGGTGILYHSTNNGDSWTTIETPFLEATTPLTTQLSSNNTLFIAADSLGIYKTTNLGGVWQLETGIPKTKYHQLLAARNGTLFAATDRGVYILPKDKTSWQEYNEGLRSIPSLSLAQDDQGYIYVGSASSGVYKSKSSFGTMQSISNKNTVVKNVNLYPNPSTEKAGLQLSLPTTANLKIEVVDILGNVRYVVQDGMVSEGDHNFEIRSNLLPNGKYYISIIDEIGTSFVPFSVVR